jgi:hypothetical protein
MSFRRQAAGSRCGREGQPIVVIRLQGVKLAAILRNSDMIHLEPAKER